MDVFYVIGSASTVVRIIMPSMNVRRRRVPTRLTRRIVLTLLKLLFLTLVLCRKSLIRTLIKILLLLHPEKLSLLGFKRLDFLCAG